MIAPLNQIAGGWWDWMSAMFWQVALVFALVWIIDRLGAKHLWPPLRSLLWLLVFVKLVIPPDFATGAGIFQWVPGTATQVSDTFLGVTRSTAGEGVQEATSPAGAGEGTITAPAQDPAPESADTSSPALAWQVYPFGIWFAGMVVLGVLLWTNKRRLRRWHDSDLRTETLPDWFHEILLEAAKSLRLERLPGVVFTDHVPAPAVYGFFRQVLLLPRRFADELSREELRYMVVHELAHLKRRDLIIHGLSTALQIIYWFHPLVIIAGMRLKQVREICCDATAAVAIPAERSGYRDTLINAARRLLTESVSPVMGFIGVFEEPTHIITRIKWLERDMELNKYLVAVISIFLITAFLLLVYPMVPSSGVGAAPIDDRLFTSNDTAAATGLEEGSCMYGRHETREMTVAVGITVDTKLVSVEEIWWDARRVCFVEEGRRWIVDRTAGTLLYVNDISETWLQSTLPLNRAGIFAPECADFWEPRKVFGEVVETGGKETIQGLPCTEFKLTTWEVAKGRRINQCVVNVWVTTAVPIASDILDYALESRRYLYGATRQLLLEMRKMPGYQMRIEFTPGSDLGGTRRLSETTTIVQRPVDETVFTVPAHYIRLTQFRRADM